MGTNTIIYCINNNYTTYSYNKWHRSQQKCPFCQQIPQNKYHITIECTALSSWTEIEEHLQIIHPSQITDTEKIFGIQGITPNIILRNWMTFILRQIISEQENKAFYNKKGLGNIEDIKLLYNQKIKTDVWNKYNIYTSLGRIPYFTKTFAVNDHLIIWENQQWQILTIFKL